MSFLHAVERTIRRHAMLAGGETVLAAVSGGSDSVGLLHALVGLAPAWRLRVHVVHVDHGLRADAARDADFVRTLGARLRVPVEIATVRVPPGSSLEAQARTARYAALGAAADRLGAARIALGHTADDQAETVLMRLLAGAGVRGLAGIPPVRGRFVRPLIEQRRRDIVTELQRTGLAWVEDPSNRDPKFLRNRVRHELLPLLADAYSPGVSDALARVAALARGTLDALDRVAAAELDRWGVRADGAVTLPVGPLAALPPPVAAEVLRRAAAELGGRAPLRAWAHRGLGRVLASPPPRRPVALGGVTVEVSGPRLRLSTRRAPALAPRTLVPPARLALPEIGRTLEARLLDARDYAIPRGPDRVAFDADALPGALAVRCRRAGDRFTPFGGGERRLKTFLIDAKVPRWERGRVPLVEAAGAILWVAGFRRGALAPVTAASRRVLELALSPPALPR